MNTTIYWPEGLPLPMVGARSSFESKSIQSEMESSRLRIRRLTIEPHETIEVIWHFTREQYTVFKAFFDIDLINGSQFFLMELIGYDELVHRTVAFVDAKYSFSREDNLYAVSGMLEVYQSEVFDAKKLHGVSGRLTGQTHLKGRLRVLFNTIPFKLFNGPVYAILPYSEGVYVSGRFSEYGAEDTIGWKPCLGIARILKTGELDTTFQPGGLLGGGFDFLYPYFAPTQLQGAADGGVFVGMSFAFLPEPLLFEHRAEATRGDLQHLFFNGDAVPPVVKLNFDGTLDETFDASFLVGATDRPKFMSFHMNEVLNRFYFTYHRDVVCIEDIPGGGTFDLGGECFAVLEARERNGTLIRRAFRRTDMGQNQVSESSVDPKMSHQVFIDHTTARVYWGGPFGNSRTAGGLVLGIPGEDELGLPEAWKMFDVEFPGTFPGIIGFDFDLNFDEAVDWVGYSAALVAAGKVSSFVPHRILRGCFRGSLVCSTEITGDPGSFLTEGRWRGSETGAYKGGLHFCFDQHFEPSASQTEHGSSPQPFSLNFLGTGMMKIYSPYSHDPRQFDATYHFQDAGEAVYASQTHHEAYTNFDPLSESGSYFMSITPEPVIGCKWIVHTPEYRPFVSSPTHLWDLRNMSADPDDTAEHGFDPFAGDVVDHDGCHNCRVLQAMYDPSSRQATVGTSENLGVFFTGMIEKFKGEVKFDKHGQLAKLRYNGAWDSSFESPLFGPEEMVIDGDPGNTTLEVHHNKINCVAISPGGKVLYVGGKFTEVVGSEFVAEVGHICNVHINTGELLV